MKKVALSMLFIVSLAMGRLDMNIPEPLEKSLKMSAKAMNKELPIMLDVELRHDKVEANGINLVYKFTLIHFTKDEMNAERLKNVVESDIRKQVCTDIDSQIMLKQGMRMVYDYVDKNKKHITQFVYDANVCDLLTNLDQIKQTIKDISRNKELTLI